MASPASGNHQAPGLYREPMRTSFMVLLLILLAINVGTLVGRAPNQYRFQHVTNSLVALLLVCNHLSVAYTSVRWRGLTVSLSLALSLGILLWMTIR